MRIHFKKSVSASLAVPLEHQPNCPITDTILAKPLSHFFSFSLSKFVDIFIVFILLFAFTVLPAPNHCPYKLLG